MDVICLLWSLVWPSPMINPSTANGLKQAGYTLLSALDLLNNDGISLDQLNKTIITIPSGELSRAREVRTVCLVPFIEINSMSKRNIITAYKYVRAGETDQMGFVYYGRFAEFYEIGRVETIRALGLSYKDLEDQDNIIMPVVSMQIRYLRPALYDELLDIKTILRHVRKMSSLFYRNTQWKKNSSSTQLPSGYASWME